MNKHKYQEYSSNLQHESALSPTTQYPVTANYKTNKYNKRLQINIPKLGANRYDCHQKTTIILSKAKHNEQSLNLMQKSEYSNLPNKQQANRDQIIKHNKHPKISLVNFNAWKLGKAKYVIPQKITVILNKERHNNKSQKMNFTLTNKNDELNLNNTEKKLIDKNKIMKLNKSPKISFINFNDLKAGISQYNYHKKQPLF